MCGGQLLNGIEPMARYCLKVRQGDAVRDQEFSWHNSPYEPLHRPELHLRALKANADKLALRRDGRRGVCIKMA